MHCIMYERVYVSGTSNIHKFRLMIRMKIFCVHFPGFNRWQHGSVLVFIIIMLQRFIMIIIMVQRFISARTA